MPDKTHSSPKDGDDLNPGVFPPGKIALEMGFCTEAQLYPLFRGVEAGMAFGGFARALLDQEILTPLELEIVLAEQARRSGSPEHKAMTTLLIWAGVGTRDIDELLEERRRRAEGGVEQPLGDLAAELGFINRATLEDVLCQITMETDQTLGAGVAEESPLPSNEVPEILGRYEILAEIGRGGMGVVYKARHIKLGKIVALKTISTGSAASDAKVIALVREARSMAELNHPGIVQVHDADEDQGVSYFTMDFVDGHSLDQEIAERRITPRRAIEIILAVTESLAFAHRKGLLHRDVKPGNVLLSRDGRLFLSDFGLSARVETDRDATVTGALGGTPAYMSPEQIERSAPADARSDIYSLGAVLYELLTGDPPLKGSLNALMVRISREEPVPPTQIVRRIHKDIEVICLKCLEKSLAKRYQTCDELAADLKRYLDGEPIHATPPGITARIRRRFRKQRSLLLTGLVVLSACAALATAGMIYFLERAKEEGSWVLAFQDDFERTELGPQWKTSSGAWRIHEGSLCSDADQTCQIDILKNFSGDVRVEYEAVSMEWPVCSLSCILCGGEEDALGQGYYLGFGDNYNVRSYILRRMIMVSNNPDATVERGRRYQIVAERRDSRVSMKVDGREINSFEDFFPLRGEDQARVALYTFHSHVHFDKVRVYVRHSAEKLSRQRVADVLYEEGAFIRAAKLFGEESLILEGRDGEIARFKEALSLHRAGREGIARGRLEELRRSSADPLIRAHCAVHLAEEEFISGSVDRGWASLVNMGAMGTGDEAERVMAFGALQTASELEERKEGDRCFELHRRLAQSFGGKIIPAYLVLPQVLKTLARRGQYEEMGKLTETVRLRIRSPVARANDISWFMVPLLGVEHPVETADVLLEGFHALEKEHWFPDRIQIQGLPLYAMVVAKAGRHEEGMKYFRGYEPLRAMVEGDPQPALLNAKKYLQRLKREETADAGDPVLEMLFTCWLLLGAGETGPIRSFCPPPPWKAGECPKEVLDLPLHFALVLILADLVDGDGDSAQKLVKSLLPKDPCLGFLRGTVSESAFRNVWLWESTGVLYEDSPWSWDFWLGLKAELDKDRTDAVNHYKKALNRITWNLPIRSVIRQALTRLGE